MLQDTGNVKRPTPGKCIICNEPSEQVSNLGKIEFCDTCASLLTNEDELAKRIVWD